MSSSNESNTSPDIKKKGRKKLEEGQERRRHRRLICPNCHEGFVFDYKDKSVLAPRVVDPSLSQKEKNKIYRQRYKEKQEKVLSLDTNEETT